MKNRSLLWSSSFVVYSTFSSSSMLFSKRLGQPGWPIQSETLCVSLENRNHSSSNEEYNREFLVGYVVVIYSHTRGRTSTQTNTLWMGRSFFSSDGHRLMADNFQIFSERRTLAYSTHHHEERVNVDYYSTKNITKTTTTKNFFIY